MPPAVGPLGRRYFHEDDEYDSEGNRRVVLEDFLAQKENFDPDQEILSEEMESLVFLGPFTPASYRQRAPRMADPTAPDTAREITLKGGISLHWPKADQEKWMDLARKDIIETKSCD